METYLIVSGCIANAALGWIVIRVLYVLAKALYLSAWAHVRLLHRLRRGGRFLTLTWKERQQLGASVFEDARSIIGGWTLTREGYELSLSGRTKVETRDVD